MRYYKLDADGWPRAEQAWPEDGFDYLPNRPDAYHRWDGSQWVEDTTTKLAEVEAECVARIDRAASRARARFITSGVGQEAVYLTKYDEAKAYKAASGPTDSDYPYLQAEAGRRNMTMSALADEVIGRRNEWTDPPGAEIEAERVGGKDDVRAATTVAGKEEARDSAVTALEAIEPQ